MDDFEDGFGKFDGSDEFDGCGPERGPEFEPGFGHEPGVEFGSGSEFGPEFGPEPGFDPEPGCGPGPEPLLYLYLDCQSGIAGDMLVAALLDLGASEEVLRAALKSLPLSGYSIEVSRVKKAGIDCCDFNVVLDAEHDGRDHDMAWLHGEVEGLDGGTASVEVEEEPAPGRCHGHHHGDGHGPGGPVPGHGHDAHHHHGHAHRGLPEVEAIIDAGALTSGARELARRAFRTLAEAEARAHALPVEQVHFHEVGAVDSIVDIVAASVLLDDLGLRRVVVPVLVDGYGSVRCQHGVIPVPAPATLNICIAHGLPLAQGQVEGELVTPTGAALVAALDPVQELPARYRVHACGLGAGKRAYARPSVLRAMVIEELEPPAPKPGFGPGPFGPGPWGPQGDGRPPRGPHDPRPVGGPRPPHGGPGPEWPPHESPGPERPRPPHGEPWREPGCPPSGELWRERTFPPRDQHGLRPPHEEPWRGPACPTLDPYCPCGPRPPHEGPEPERPRPPHGGPWRELGCPPCGEPWCESICPPRDQHGPRGPRPPHEEPWREPARPSRDSRALRPSHEGFGSEYPRPSHGEPWREPGYPPRDPFDLHSPRPSHGSFGSEYPCPPHEGLRPPHGSWRGEAPWGPEDYRGPHPRDPYAPACPPPEPGSWHEPPHEGPCPPPEPGLAGGPAPWSPELGSKPEPPAPGFRPEPEPPAPGPAFDTQPGPHPDQRERHIVKLECDIDDSTGEQLAYAAERLREAGAREVHWLPILGKKGRPAWQLEVLCMPEDAGRLEEIIFAETTTIGLRRQPMERTVLPRSSEIVQTAYGPVHCKAVALPDGSERVAPEYEDCAAVAREQGVPLRRVMEAALWAAGQ